MRILDFELESVGASERYYHTNWERSKSPLLDAFGAIACHVGPEEVGAPESFATACNWCFNRGARERPGPISKYETWDGFTAVFRILAERYRSELNDDDREWMEALK